MASDLDLDAYLARIGEKSPLAPTSDALLALHRAHCAAIPFENLDILLGRGISLDLPALEAKLVRGRRGGYCFEQNTLFRAALEAMGFRVTALAARVRVGTTEIRPRTHMLLRIDLPEGAFLADVGFGGDGLVHPIPLAEGPETWVGERGTGCGARATSGSWKGTRAVSGPTSTPSRSSPISRWTSRWPTTSRAPTLVRPSS